MELVPGATVVKSGWPRTTSAGGLFAETRGKLEAKDAVVGVIRDPERPVAIHADIDGMRETAGGGRPALVGGGTREVGLSEYRFRIRAIAGGRLAGKAQHAIVSRIAHENMACRGVHRHGGRTGEMAGPRGRVNTRGRKVRLTEHDVGRLVGVEACRLRRDRANEDERKKNVARTHGKGVRTGSVKREQIQCRHTTSAREILVIAQRRITASGIVPLLRWPFRMKPLFKFACLVLVAFLATSAAGKCERRGERIAQSPWPDHASRCR